MKGDATFDGQQGFISIVKGSGIQSGDGECHEVDLVGCAVARAEAYVCNIVC